MLITISSFNPCFSGRSSLIAWPAGCDASSSEFQSLFFWKILSHSIPRQYLIGLFLCFNPCFSGRSSLILRASGLPFRWRRVSILVFLEDPLSLSLIALPERSVRSFNPCFSGRSSLISELLNFLSCSLYGFNPCFSGRSSLIHHTGNLPRWWKVFQSLFFWKILSHKPSRLPGQRPRRVSILVFLEDPLS